MSPKTSDRHQGSVQSSRFGRAVARFDQANAEDPNRQDVRGRSHPKELVYARRMTEWLARFEPDASEPLQLAARCQHIRRWVIPRTRFGSGREGYREWRTTLAAFHADTAGAILREVGYDDQVIARVQALLRKERLTADPDVQTLEDVICLVFFQYSFAEFAVQHDADKLRHILRRTWRKMSERGRAAALALDLEPHLRTVITEAVAPRS